MSSPASRLRNEHRKMRVFFNNLDTVQVKALDCGKGNGLSDIDQIVLTSMVCTGCLFCIVEQYTVADRKFARCNRKYAGEC